MLRVSFRNFAIAAIPVVAAGVVLFIRMPVAHGISPLTTPADPEQSTTLTQRLAVRENTYKIQLDGPTRSRLFSRCVLIQTSMATIKTRDITAANNRRQTYSDLASSLAAIIDNLSRQNVNTAGVVGAQTQFNNAINTYLADAVQYKTAMDDAVTMDCTSDVTGFKVSILDARALRAQLIKDVAAIKSSTLAIAKALSEARAPLIKNTGVSTRKASQ